MSCDYSLLVVGAGVVLVPAAHEPGRYSDLIDSMLLAQLVANKKIEKAPHIDWYNAYVEFLDDYWLRHSRARQEWHVPQDSVECVGDWFIASMFKEAVNKRGAAAATLQRLTRLSGTEPAMELLRGHMQKISTGEPGDVLSPDMAVRLLVVVAHTPTSVTSVYMEIKTDQDLDSNPLAQRYQAKDVRGSVCMRYAGANLSETLYSPVRDAIALKVKGRLEDNVAMLTLTDEGSDKGICPAD